jgi:hypothetical protein
MNDWLEFNVFFHVFFLDVIGADFMSMECCELFRHLSKHIIPFGVGQIAG